MQHLEVALNTMETGKGENLFFDALHGFTLTVASNAEP